MIVNLAVVLLVAKMLRYLMEKLKLPGLLGFLFTGIILGPYLLDFISADLLHLSGELRTTALIIILIRAGLSIQRKTLNKVGTSALKMSFIPGIIEGSTITFIGYYWLDFSLPEAGMLGFILAAVSPAVVVPQMLNLKERGFGKNREVPTLVLAGASVDDVFAITIFGLFLAAGTGDNANIFTLLMQAPLSIVLGICMGAGLGFLLLEFFKKFPLRDTRKLIYFMIVAILFYELSNYIPIASLLGIMTMGLVILEKDNNLAHRLSLKFDKIWVLAEILLFVLIGARVDIFLVWEAGLTGMVIIALGLVARSLGVFLSLLGSNLSQKERLFCIIAYTPKATVQAAIGAIPLTMGIESGDWILAVAVLAILLTAPLGAAGIHLSHKRLLEPSSSTS